MLLLPTILAAASTSDQIFGTLEAPPGVDKYQQNSGADIGIFFFISRGIQIGTIIMGIWVFLNVLMAGYVYISSSGDAKAATKVKDILTMSAIGLMMIITSYTVAGVLGLVLFGDATYLINPQIEAI